MNTQHPLDQALEFCINGFPDRSEEILRNCDQTDPRVLYNLGWHEIRHGRLKAGLELLDHGRFISVYGSGRIPGSIWHYQDLKGKTILFRCENGFGDQIMNFRFADDFKKLGAQVVIACSAELKGLFAKHGYVCVDNEAAQHVHYDYWIPSMSAAHVLGYDQHNFPGTPFLTAEPRRFGNESTLKVGIRWAGNPQFEHEQHRRFDPQPLIDLHTIKGVSLYSLQRDDDCVQNLPFTDLRYNLNTWEDTASIIAGLDLVISSCTSVAHLAAALGKETWIIVPVLPYYPWAMAGDRSVWYDSVRIFRQEKYGDWSATMINVRQALEKRVSSNILKLAA